MALTDGLRESQKTPPEQIKKPLPTYEPKISPSPAPVHTTLCTDDAAHRQNLAVTPPLWWEHRWPFRHLRAQNVLGADAYHEVSTAFRSILDTTLGGGDGPYRMHKSNPNYDADVLAMDNILAPAFHPFFSEAWLKPLFGSLGLPEISRIDGGLHSSPSGSRNGWIHTDLCSGWFDESDMRCIPFPNRRKCDYFTGASKADDAQPVEYIRSATLIYYFCNEGWSEGDGGETGLYSSPKVGPTSTYELIPPIDNTLLLFECSPHSYHRFIANPLRRRNSLILWLHSTAEQGVQRWGTTINRRKPK